MYWYVVYLNIFKGKCYTRKPFVIFFPSNQQAQVAPMTSATNARKSPAAEESVVLHKSVLHATRATCGITCKCKVLFPKFIMCHSGVIHVRYFAVGIKHSGILTD